MAKVEQFPEETGIKDRTEDDNFIDDQETAEDSGALFDPEEDRPEESFFDDEWPATARQPESVLSFFDFEEPVTTGEPGKTGEPEKTGEPLVTPVNGTDSWQDADAGEEKKDDILSAETVSLPAESGSGQDDGGPGKADDSLSVETDSSRNAEESGRDTAEESSREPSQESSPEPAKEPSQEYDSLVVGTDRDRKAAGRPEKVDDSLLTGSGQGDADMADLAGAAAGLAMSGSEDAAGVAKAVSQAYEDQIRRHREKIRYIRILCAAVALVVIALVALFFSTRHYNRAEITKVRDFVAEEGSSCVNLGGCILQYGPNGATCAGTDGRVRWSITYEMDQPIVSISDKVAAIADYGGRTIYVMDKKKQLCTITTSLPIHKVSASDSGEVAAVLDDKNATWIRLYSDKGKEIAYFTRSVEENGYPMDVAVSPDGKKVCISSLKLKDSSAVSTLSFYDFGKAGQKYDQYMVGSFEYENEVFPYVHFIGNGACCAASDSRLVVFDTGGTEPKNSINNMLTENLQGVFKSGDRIVLVFMDLTRENLYRLDLYGRNGKKEGSIGFSLPFKNIQIKGSRIYINNEQSMQIYTLNGNLIFDGGFDRAVKVLIPRWLGRLTAVTVNEIDEVKLR